MRLLFLIAALIVTLFACTGAAWSAPGAIHIQGRLLRPDLQPVPDGTVSVRFSLWDALQDGTERWNQTITALDVKGGLFSTDLNVATPVDLFNTPLWLEVKVGTDPAMAPRQALSGLPYAMNAWSLGGNSGTSPATQFLGTTDAQPLVLKANGHRGLQLQDAVSADGTYRSTNVLLGSEGNAITAGVVGATVSGGSSVAGNKVGGDFGTIAGGASNFTDIQKYATIAGGNGNIAQGTGTFIGGGTSNNTQADFTTIAGGSGNYMLGGYGFIGGGQGNTVTSANGTIGGGANNATSDTYTTIGGGFQNSISGTLSVIAGGSANTATASNAAIGGGSDNHIDGMGGTIAGGTSNTITSSGYGMVGGGHNNIVGKERTPADYSVIAGGYQNYIGLGGHSSKVSSIAGGNGNYIIADGGSIGGGYQNDVIGNYGTVPGGAVNTARGTYSLAAGYYAAAMEDGSFVWSDASAAQVFRSPRANQFCIRALNGLVIETNGDVPIYTGVGTIEANRYVTLLNSPNSPSASGLKAGGILCADSYAYAYPGKNDMVVKGTLSVGYPNPSPYTFAVNGSAYAVNGYSSSDARYKKNVHPLENPLETVASLRGVSFDWDRETWKEQNFPEGRQIGFIAQEVEKVLPEVVATDSKGYKAVSYQSIVPVLVESVKALKQQNEDLAARNRSLEERLDALAAQVATLQQER